MFSESSSASRCNVILDVFTGLVINLDRSIKIGDWVEIHHSSFSSKVYGKVVEINWRTLRLDVGGGRIVVVPSGLMASTPFTAYSHPDDRAGFNVLITLDFSVPVERALRILLAGTGQPSAIVDPSNIRSPRCGSMKLPPAESAIAWGTRCPSIPSGRGRAVMPSRAAFWSTCAMRG